MKKNANIIEYVKKYKYKYGISNISENDRVMKMLTACAAVVWCYAFFMIMVFILGMLGKFRFGGFDFELYKRSFFVVVGGAVLMIGGAVFLCCKQRLAAAIVTIVSQPIVLVEFAYLMKDPAGKLLFSFYWRHAIPAILLVIFAILIIAAIVNGIVKDNKLYNQLVDALYKQYGTRDGEKLNEEQWQEFLSNYDPKKINSIIDDTNNPTT